MLNLNSVRIDEIQIGDRFRKDLGDISGLAASIADIGLLHPVVITPDKYLIAGQRRIAACRSLGWIEVPVNIVDLAQVERGEYDENTCRKDFTPSEAVAIWHAMEDNRSTFPAESAGKVYRKCRAAAYVGISHDKLFKAGVVVKSGDEKLIAQMDETGNVDRAYRTLLKQQEEGWYAF